MTEAFARLPRGRVLQYHNVTPAHFFAPYDAGIFRLASLGRQELATLAGRTDVALGDSAYNRPELEALGFGNTGVFPIAIDVDRITAAPRRPALERVLDDGPLNFLFVGRIVPNKKIEDHIRLAEVYKRYVDVNYRFIFVGKTDGVPALLRHDPGAHRRVPDAGGPFPLHRAGARRGPGHLLPHRQRLHLAVGARGLLRAAARGDGRRRARAGLRLDRRSRHAGRRRRAVHPQGPRAGRRAARRAGLQRGAARPRDRRPAAAPGRLRRRADPAGPGRRWSPAPFPLRPSSRAKTEFDREDRIHRSTLRRRDPRRVRVPLPAHRRAPRRRATTSRC